MKLRSWFLAASVVFVAGCGVNNDQTTDPETGHGRTLDPTKPKMVWGPAAPEPPLMPSPVPQIPEQPGSPMNPGDGPKAEDKLVPSTANPAAPK